MYVYSTVDHRQGWTMLGQGSKAGSLSTPHCMSKSRPKARSLSRYVESTQKNTHWYSADVETSSRKFEILTEKVIIYRGCSQLMTPVFLGGLGNIWPLLLSSSISSLSSIMIEDLVFLLSAACRYMYTHSIYIYTLLFHKKTIQFTPDHTEALLQHMRKRIMLTSSWMRFSSHLNNEHVSWLAFFYYLFQMLQQSRDSCTTNGVGWPPAVGQCPGAASADHVTSATRWLKYELFFFTTTWSENTTQL